MKYDWSKERLEETVDKANCWFNWLDVLSIPKAGGNYKTLKNKAKEYGIDTSHFNYAYAKTHNGKRMVKSQTTEEFFSTENTHNKAIIKREYIKRILGGVARCENPECGITEWYGKPISLQLHHINGNNKDNRIENLQLLCPNCHSQTDTYCGKSNR